MEIKISPLIISSGFVGDEMKKENGILIVIKINNEQKLLELIDNDLEQVKVFLNIEGYAGHIPLHNWLKKNKVEFFKENITDRDANKIVISIIIKLKNYYNINN